MIDSDLSNAEEAARLFTEQLTLRPLEERDAAAMALLLSEWDIVKQTATLPFPFDERSALTWIARVRRRHEAGRQLAFAITGRDVDELKGAIALNVHPDPGGAVGEIGYWLGVPFWGHGFASEAVAAVTSLALERLGISRIEAVLFKENKSSKRVLERCGYRQERSEVQRYPDRGGRRKVLIYSISRHQGSAM